MEIANKHNKGVGQVILRWLLQRGIAVIPKTTHIKRLKENLDVFDFSLTPDEIAAIDTININSRLRYDPDNCDFTLL